MAWMSKAEKLKRDYTDKYVVVDASRPELHRFRNFTGFVKTVNMNGRALVEFGEDNNIGWYDIELDFLKVVDKPKPKEPEAKAAKASPVKKDKPSKAAAADSGKKLSPLEMARMADSKKSGSAPAADSGKKLSPLEMARMADSKKGGSKPTTEAKTSPAAGSSSTADILSASRVKQGASTADILAAARTTPKAAETDTPAAAKSAPASKPAAPSGGAMDRSKMSVADMLAAARAEKNKPQDTPPQDTVAETETTPEESVAVEESTPESDSTATDTPATGDLPTDVAGMLAYCRATDGS